MWPWTRNSAPEIIGESGTSMKTSTPTQPPERHDRLVREEVHDTYKIRGKLAEPTRCPQCGAIYHNGRWSWSDDPPAEADEQLCSACHRINDRYPAGEVSLEGDFVGRHKEELIGLARNIEATERNEHPMNRIIDVQEESGRLLITTTDVHLPRRIGKAIHAAWEGDLQIHFDDEGYFASVNWQRND